MSLTHKPFDSSNENWLFWQRKFYHFPKISSCKWTKHTWEKCLYFSVYRYF